MRIHCDQRQRTNNQPFVTLRTYVGNVLFVLLLLLWFVSANRKHYLEKLFILHFLYLREIVEIGSKIASPITVQTRKHRTKIQSFSMYHCIYQRLCCLVVVLNSNTHAESHWPSNGAIHNDNILINIDTRINFPIGEKTRRCQWWLSAQASFHMFIY